MRWIDTFGLCEAHHHRIADCYKCVDLLAWENLRMGMGKRTRRRGLSSYPLKAADHSGFLARRGIPSRWPEKVDTRGHPHVKLGLIAGLIAAVTEPGDLVVDPADGSFGIMHAARRLGRLRYRVSAFNGCWPDPAGRTGLQQIGQTPEHHAAEYVCSGGLAARPIGIGVTSTPSYRRSVCWAPALCPRIGRRPLPFASHDCHRSYDELPPPVGPSAGLADTGGGGSSA
jgi:hypothetical protein